VFRRKRKPVVRADIGHAVMERARIHIGEGRVGFALQCCAWRTGGIMDLHDSGGALADNAGVLFGKIRPLPPWAIHT